MNGTVESCPANSSEVVEASSRLNCGRDLYDNIQYVCAPNVEKTALVEFCYDGIMRPIPKGNCLEINNRGFVDSDCTGFVEGCPDNYYRGNAVYKYPACLRINTDYKCYLADPSCPKITRRLTTEGSWGSSTRYETSNTTEEDVNTVPMIGLGLGLGIFFIIVVISFGVLYWTKIKERKKRAEENKTGLLRLQPSNNIDNMNGEMQNLRNGDDGAESRDENIPGVSERVESEISNPQPSNNFDDNNTETQNLGNGDDGTELHDKPITNIKSKCKTY